MDNLSTHKEKSLINYYGEEEGKKLWDRFEVHYTPKHGSWLNQAEIAIGMDQRQCLGGIRIPDIQLFKKKPTLAIEFPIVKKSRSSGNLQNSMLEKRSAMGERIYWLKH